MSEEKELKIAILIDADNISYKKIEEILNEVKRYGVPTIKRIYGDWTSPYVENWKDSLLTHAITPIQQYSYTQGKNSTDSALIIDAMDILHSDRVDGFCIVSSDSDFTRLATRLRESGKLVIGVGERKTPKPFISSCDKFIYVEILEKEVKKKAIKKKNNTVPNTTPIPVEQNKISSLDEETLELLKDTVDDTADENGWAFLGEIGSLFNKRKPDFDARNYGYAKISHLFKAYKEDFEIEERNTEKSRIKNYYIRNIINKSVNQIATKAAFEPVDITVSPQKSKKFTDKSHNQATTKPTVESLETIVISSKDNQVTNTPTHQATAKPTSESLETAIIPSKGNHITSEDVSKHQIRITKDLKSLFPNKTKKIRVLIKNEHECAFSYRRDRSHVLSLGQAAAEELGLEVGATFKLIKLGELSYQLEKNS
ncbi:NYN domain-containing protein [Sphingobacterium sp. SRCM116780]|uniref:NYN domain-containing protein n=1 Tax=Sphingobacterium sp. SRCM116780 TaxID=2907623 RepID=UPI001F2CA26A|nr:NYN domain-containing protein [Sphingobacterium sp. SRCM116780]UIR54654.1 NYN domain-containing protein [Sphingobacterium sp. SRCM116780]